MKKACILLTTMIVLSLFVDVPNSHAQGEDLERAKQMNQKVMQLIGQGKYAEAVRMAKEALTIREKALSPDHADVALSLNNLALLYYRLGDYAKAEPLYQRSLAIKEKALGPDHRDVNCDAC